MLVGYFTLGCSTHLEDVLDVHGDMYAFLIVSQHILRPSIHVCDATACAHECDAFK